MRRRARPRGREDLPAHLATFDEGDWPGARPADAPGSARQWARLRWNRARDQWRRANDTDNGRKQR